MDDKTAEQSTSLRSYFNKKSADNPHIVTCRLCKRDVKAAKGWLINRYTIIIRY
jgi:hypothetical protein